MPAIIMKHQTTDSIPALSIGKLEVTHEPGLPRWNPSYKGKEIPAELYEVSKGAGLVDYV